MRAFVLACTALLLPAMQAEAFQCNAAVAGSRGLYAVCDANGNPELAVDVRRQAAKTAFVAAARAGPKNGVSASPEQRADIENKLAVLCSLNPTAEPAYALLRPPFQYFDGTFSLLYTNTTGGSSGKLGPFVGLSHVTNHSLHHNSALIEP
jgi:hypothetical protein